MIKQKKIIFFAAMLVCSALLNGIAAAESSLVANKKYSWFSKAEQAGKQPSFEISVSELKEYETYCIGNPDDKVLYLTFDFGYVNENVEKCVDILNKNNVKGAFFILEHVINNNTEFIKKIAQSGHEVANHTMKHKDMTKINGYEEYAAEVTGLDELYENKIGYKMTKFYRPPKGEYSKQNLEYNKTLGYKTIFWSLAYADWDNNNQPDPQKSIEKLLSKTHNGAVILLHPTSATNAAILDTLIREWTKQGYRFGTLAELTA